MRLFIDTTFEGNGNWEGFEFCINRENATVDKVIVERSKGGWDWDKVEAVHCKWKCYADRGAKSVLAKRQSEEYCI